MSRKRSDSVELLHSLGYLYLRAGHARRALVLLLLANQIEPDNTGVLRTLTSALIENGSWQRALTALDRLAGLETEQAEATPLLRARALWMLGDEAEARRCFADYVAARGRT